MKVFSNIFIFSFIFLSLFLSLGRTSYAQAVTPIKILLVPGHDNEVWGAQYGNMKEADMTLNVATRIFNILKTDPRFEVHITRDSTGYTKEFSDYFTDHRADIVAFEENAKKEMQSKIANGSFVEMENVPHHTVGVDVADRLYGFNKWASDNKMDAVIHIHFNDYPRARSWTIGKYTGFVIYVPEGQLPNFKESARLGANILIQLKKKYITSTFEREKGGLIPDQKLIAIGANGTLIPSVRAVLIEYGYIYEKKFRTTSARLAAFKNMAELTVTGIKNYFSDVNN